MLAIYLSFLLSFNFDFLDGSAALSYSSVPPGFFLLLHAQFRIKSAVKLNASTDKITIESMTTVDII